MRYTLALLALAAFGAVKVRYDETLCLSYEARLEGGYLIVETRIEKPWHTFAMDNVKRAEEKLAGKKAISMDRSTEIAVTGLKTEGSWLQTAPKDFSKPELRWFSFGFEDRATFAVKASRTAGPAQLTIKGQACTDAICKNIDVIVPVAAGGSKAAVQGLIAVR